MATISSLGVGSGLDIRSLVDQLVAAERAPAENRIERQEERLQTQISGLGQVRSALGTFQETVQEFARPGSFVNVEANSSNADALGVTASDAAESGSFDVQVLQRAQAQSVASEAFASRSDPVGTGTLTFRFGAVESDEAGAVTGFTQNQDAATRSIEIDPANNSLTGIRDSVNAADIGIRATLINDGTGERLVFSSTETGAANGFVVDVDADDPGSALNSLAFNENATSLQLNRASQDAQLTIDGLAVTRASNSIDDLIEGVTLDLNQASEETIRVDVTRDNSGAGDKVREFVDSYNALQEQVNELTRFDPETRESGPLNGNGVVRGIMSSLRSALTSPVDSLEGRGVRSLADIGILTSRDGTLSLDEGRLQNALDSDPDAVQALFSPTGIVEGAGFSFDSSRSSTQSGRYAIDVSEVATRGLYAGQDLGADPFASPIEIREGENTFRVSIDGTRSAVLTLRAGTYYSAEAVTSELQALINGDSRLSGDNRELGVSFEDGGFVLRSQRYGAESVVSISDAAADISDRLGLVNAEGTAGTDVQGTIGGREAEGFGQFLTAQSGPADGLKVRVDGSQTGALGSVVFSGGVMGTLDRLISNATSSSSGSLTNISNGLSDRLSRLEDDRERLDRRMAQVERRYTEQFSAMDALVAQLQETSNFLDQQLSNLGDRQ